VTRAPLPPEGRRLASVGRPDRLPRIWTVPVGPVERASGTTVPVNGAITCQLVRFKVQPRARPSVSAKELLISVGPLGRWPRPLLRRDGR
jgi:hypothetical protein